MQRNPKDFPDLNKLPPETLVAGHVADAMFGHSRATRHRRVNNGTFPKPRKIGGSMARYVLGELRAQLKADAEGGR